MNKYNVKSGQNLYDVALTLYGSIEGVFDLLVSNSNISFNTILSKGMELNYHEDFVVNQNIVDWFESKKINIKNGRYEISEIDVRASIIKWIDDTNKEIFNKYLNGILTKATIDADSLVFDWDRNDVVLPIANDTLSDTIKDNTAIFQVPTQNKWDTLYDNQKYFVVTDNIVSFAEKIAPISLSTLSKNELIANLNVLFANGMITLPTDETEKSSYYDLMSTPKILIQQSGKSSVISMQIQNNNFIAIDWGDDTGLDFYHYQDSTTTAAHTYSDNDEHTIIIYGNNKFINLDITKVNGIYYALSEIYINNEFITPYPNATSLNKLFITKSEQ